MHTQAESRAGSSDSPITTLTAFSSHITDFNQEQLSIIYETTPGGATNIQDIYPLTPLQEGLLFHHVLDHTRDTYVLSLIFECESKRDADALTHAIRFVIARHDVLRAAILWEGLPRPVHVVYRLATLPVEELPLDRNRTAIEQLKERALPDSYSWDLTRAPLLRLRLAPDSASSTWYALLQVHHVICDHRSLQIIVSEIAAHLRQNEKALPVPASYRDYVLELLSHTDIEQAEKFFTAKLQDVYELTLPFGLINPDSERTPPQEARLTIDPQVSFRLRAEARRMRISPARLFHAAWALVLARTSARDDVVFGTVILTKSQRSASGTRMVGLAVNTLPLRISLADLSPNAYVEHVNQELTQLLEHENAPLVLAQRCAAIPKGTPLFTAVFNYRRVTTDLPKEFAAVAGVRLLESLEAHTNYPISVTVEDDGYDFLAIATSDGRIDPGRLLGYISECLDSLADELRADSQAAALSLRVLPSSELDLLLRGFNATSTKHRQTELVHELFEEQVRRTPHVVAVAKEGESLTYSQLNARANQLAWHLRDKGVGPDVLVGIHMERGLEMVVGLLGILKAGGAYLPLDPNHPTDRLQHMLEDAAPRVVLTETESKGVLPSTHAEVIALDKRLQETTGNFEEDLPASELRLTLQNLVYVIYTSGSTGKPKAVAMRHRSMANLIDWHRRSFGTEQGERILQFAALSFDVAFQEIFSALCTGATLVLLDEWLRKDPKALTELLSSQSIQRLFVPPLMLQGLAEYASATELIPRSLRHVITAGEQLRITPEIRTFFRRLTGCQLHNHYGPTETHVVTALSLNGDPDEWPELPAIGRPIANTQIYVLDSHQQPVPIGVTGEIYISGAGVARGYLNRAELTAERFLPDPFSADAKAEMYKTGDLGRWRADGKIEYLGRNDHQVKIRGFRIELGEIEAQLIRHQEVKEAVVLAREDLLGQKRLVGYVIPAAAGHTPDSESLREHLERELPEYMIPSAFVVLEALPLTPNGKLDRRALPPPQAHPDEIREYAAPRTELERQLTAIWSEVLHVDRVGVHDNFFELGGNSILAMKLVVKISQSLSIHPPLLTIFRFPTVEKLAQLFQMLQIADQTSVELTQFDEGAL